MKIKSILFTALLLLLTTPSLFAAQATLSWNPNSELDLAGYKVYYGNSTGSYQWSVDVKDVNSYTISNLVEGEEYFFAATAYDFSGNESGYSNEVSYDVPITSLPEPEPEPEPDPVIIPEPAPDTTPPADPEGMGVTGGNGVSWNPNDEDDLEGYVVYRNGRFFTTTIEARITLKGRNKHKDWRDYYVKAYDTSGNLSGPSDSIRVKFRRNRIST